MAQTVTIDGVDRTTKVPRESIEIAESLFLGEVGEGKLIVRDTVGNIAIKGLKDWSIDQDASTPARIGTGKVGSKTIRGRLDPQGAGRDIEVALKDSNRVLSLKLARGAVADRDAETVGVRMTWVVANLEALGLCFDFGRVTYPTDVGMDANDCQGRAWGDIIADCAKAVRFNYGVRWNDDEEARELVFRDQNAQTADTADGRISNDPDDIDSETTFAASASDPVTHTEDPEHVYSGMLGKYAKGYVYRTRSETADEFIDRDGVSEDTGDKNQATAERNADTALWESRDEERLIDLVVRLRKDQLGKFPVGFRTEVKQVHLGPEGWSDFRWASILRRRISQPLGTDFDYDCRLSLSPNEDGPPVGVIVQTAVLATGPGGGTASFPNPVTPGNLLVYMACKRTDGVRSGPGAPNTDVALARWGAGAWTNATPNTDDVAVAWDDPRAYEDNLKLYWKVADDDSQDCYLDEYTVSACWELSGSTMTGATIVYQNLHAAGTTRAIGSLGTPAANQVALLMVAMGAGAASPVPVLVALNTGDWIRDIHGDGYAHTWPSESNSIGFNQPAPPETWIGHQITDGSALAATVTDTYSHKWGGIAVLLALA